MSSGFVLPQDGKAARGVTNVRGDKIIGPLLVRVVRGGALPRAGDDVLRTEEEERPLFAFPGRVDGWTSALLPVIAGRELGLNR